VFQFSVYIWGLLELVPVPWGLGGTTKSLLICVRSAAATAAVLREGVLCSLLQLR
jgi:hypothetical protein